ncbi:hypothetical protein BDF14DRAFT_870519 [Spinellus fusiger]|nr:hypothetical protein BDF14DRAFT_870519 [Spinellus fusiger]
MGGIRERKRDLYPRTSTVTVFIIIAHEPIDVGRVEHPKGAVFCSSSNSSKSMIHCHGNINIIDILISSLSMLSLASFRNKHAWRFVGACTLNQKDVIESKCRLNKAQFVLMGAFEKWEIRTRARRKDCLYHSPCEIAIPTDTPDPVLSTIRTPSFALQMTARLPTEAHMVLLQHDICCNTNNP